MDDFKNDSALQGLLGAHAKLIMDPVHGGIPVLAHEVEVIDHPLFQRLRFICQNDILSMVFPGATHSRFLHSIGAMHVGGRMFESMVANLLHKTPRKSVPKIDQELLSAIEYFRKLVRLACLLHDSGHCSFSHQFNRSQSVARLMSRPDAFDQLWNGIATDAFYSVKPQTLAHEHYSARVAYEILDELDIESFGIDKFDILWLLETTSTSCSKRFVEHARQLWRLIDPHDESETPDMFGPKLSKLFGHIVSGELDADRADYMLRDGFHSSVTIGGFNLDHLLSNLTIGYCPQTQWLGIAVLRKGLGSLEDFVYSRYQMYRQVYAHKTAQGFDWLLQRAIDEVLREPDVYQDVSESLSDIKAFTYLTDDFFWQAFKRLARQQESYSRHMVHRKKLKHIATRVNQHPNDPEPLTKLLSQEFKVPADAIIQANFSTRFSQIDYQFDDIKVLVTDKINEAASLQLISENSEFFQKFTDNMLTHYYIDPLAESL